MFPSAADSSIPVVQASIANNQQHTNESNNAPAVTTSTPTITLSSHTPVSLPSSKLLFEQLSSIAREYVKLPRIQTFFHSIPNFFKDRQDQHQNAKNSYARYNSIIQKKGESGSLTLPRSLHLTFVQHFQFPFDSNSNFWDEHKKRLKDLESYVKSTLLTLLKETKEKGLDKFGRDASKTIMIQDIVIQFQAIVATDSKPILENGLLAQLQGTIQKSSTSDTDTITIPSSATQAEYIQTELKKVVDEIMKYFTSLATETIGDLYMSLLERKNQERILRDKATAAQLAAQAHILGDSSAVTIKEVSKKATAEVLGPMQRQLQQLQQQSQIMKQKLQTIPNLKRNVSNTYSINNSTSSIASTRGNSKEDPLDLYSDMDNYEEMAQLVGGRSHPRFPPNQKPESERKKLKLSEAPSAPFTKKDKARKFATIVRNRSAVPFNGLAYQAITSSATSIASLADDELHDAYDSFEKKRATASSSSSSSFTPSTSFHSSPSKNSNGGDRANKKDDATSNSMNQSQQ